MKIIPPWLEKRIVVTKDEVETDTRFGFNPLKRPLKEYIRFGLINLDKPPGPSSHEVTAWVKKILKISKAGHGGTLDPKVTGVLPIALEEATKAIKAFLLSGKEYVCLMQLHGDVSQEELAKIINEFTGEIYQIPPVRSSVKRTLRRRIIYSIKLLEIENRLVLFRVACEAGTYIRKLCHDMGEALGVGAHMRELRRIRSGSFHIEEDLTTISDLMYIQKKSDAYINGKPIEDLIRSIIIPVEDAFKHIPKIYIKDTAVDALCHGALLAIPGIVKLDEKIMKNSEIAIFTLKDEVVAIGKALMSTNNILVTDKGIAAEVDRVIMPEGMYPKAWRSKNHKK